MVSTEELPSEATMTDWNDFCLAVNSALNLEMGTAERAAAAGLRRVVVETAV